MFINKSRQGSFPRKSTIRFPGSANEAPFAPAAEITGPSCRGNRLKSSRSNPSMAIYVEVGALLAAFFLLFLLIKFLKHPGLVIANSVMGIIIFFILDWFFGLNIPISVFSVGLVALGGLAGVLLVVLIHFLGLGF